MYRIKNWNEHYENNRSRTVKDLAWVPIPNRHDGEAYSRLMVHKDAAMIFTTWILLLQVASRCHPRGSLLTSSCQPHNPESLAIKTRGKVEWFEKSIPFLVQIGWLEQERQEGVSVLTASCQSGDEEGTERRNRTEPDQQVLDFVEKWNSTVFSKCLQITDKRIVSIKSRLKDGFFSENWVECLDKIKTSDFCLGKNKTGWRADIDWFLRPDTCVKIMEGKYGGQKKKESFI